MTGLLSALAGANLIYGLGMLEMGVTFSFGQLVMDNEMARMIKNTVSGIPVNDESLAVEVIKKVGSFGDFLTEEHTFTHMRDLSQPKLIDRQSRGKWESAGGSDLTQRAAEEARQILKTHQAEPLSSDTLKALRAIIREAEVDYGLVR